MPSTLGELDDELLRVEVAGSSFTRRVRLAASTTQWSSACRRAVKEYVVSPAGGQLQ